MYTTNKQKSHKSNELARPESIVSMFENSRKYFNAT